MPEFLYINRVVRAIKIFSSIIVHPFLSFSRMWEKIIRRNCNCNWWARCNRDAYFFKHKMHWDISLVEFLKIKGSEETIIYNFVTSDKRIVSCTDYTLLSKDIFIEQLIFNCLVSEKKRETPNRGLLINPKDKILSFFLDGEKFIIEYIKLYTRRWIPLSKPSLAE